MKKSKLSVLALIAIVLSFSACKKDDQIAPSIQEVNPYENFSYKVDGVLKGANPSDIFYFEEDTMSGVSISMDDGYLDIAVFNVANGDTTYMEGVLTLDENNPVGSYPLSFTNEGENAMLFVKKINGGTFVESYFASYFGYIGDLDFGITPGSQTGTFTITAYDLATKKMSGTFAFNQVSSVDVDPPLATINITEGVFTDIVVDAE